MAHYTTVTNTLKHKSLTHYTQFTHSMYVIKSKGYIVITVTNIPMSLFYLEQIFLPSLYLIKWVWGCGI